MKTKISSRKFLCIIGIVVIGIVLALYIGHKSRVKTEQDIKAEQIIFSYIMENDLNIELSSKEYYQLMKGILLGEHPELTSKESAIISNEHERSLILDYAARILGNTNEDNQVEQEIPEAIQPSAYP